MFLCNIEVSFVIRILLSTLNYIRSLNQVHKYVILPCGENIGYINILELRSGCIGITVKKHTECCGIRQGKMFQIFGKIVTSDCMLSILFI